MLKFSKDTDYGLALLKYLLRQPEGAKFSARDLAEATTLPQPMVAGLLKRLTKHRILISFRGARGGYALARDEITVADAVEALQGPILLTTCNGSGVGDCLMAGGCPIVSCTHEISAAVRRALSGLDLKSLFETPTTPPSEPHAAPPSPTAAPKNEVPKKRPMKNAKQLLEGKSSQIHSTTPDASVYEALKKMAEVGIGALVVLEGEKLVGIMSERDYARKVILKDRTSKETPVRDIMTADVLCVPPTVLVDACMSLMTDKHIRHLVVMEGDQLLGVISIGDIVKAVIEGQEFTIEQLQHYVQTSR